MQRTATLVRWVTWAVTVAMAALLFTVMTGIGSGLYLVPIAQALTPYLVMPAFAFALVANSRQRWSLAITNGMIVLAFLGLLAPVTLRSAPVVDAASPTFRVLTMNALYSATSPIRVRQVLDSGADVVVVQEYTAGFEAQLDAAGVARSFPFSARLPEGGGGGLAVYSRVPLHDVVPGPLDTASAIRATIEIGGAPIHLIAVHPVTPTNRPWGRSWEPDLDAIRRAALATQGRVVVVGDFNATRWHPPFRRLLEHFTDVHESLGEGLSTSWPIGWAPFGAATLARLVRHGFVRIDHALVSDGLVPILLKDLEDNGSDHRAFVVTLAIR